MVNGAKRSNSEIIEMVNRTFIPGSEWVYFKIYTGTNTADDILKNEMYGYVSEMFKRRVIDKWFFIRYFDPDFHIRIRIHLKETRDFYHVFNRFFETFNPLVKSEIVWNIQCDTYQREMERYGFNSISLAEDLFFVDSEFVIKLIIQLAQRNDEQQRWKLALVMIDSFLSVFSYDLQQRKELLHEMAESLKKEFGFMNHATKKQLDEKYRAHRKEIENAMLWNNPINETFGIIQERKQTIFPVAMILTSMENSGKLQVPLNELLKSIQHMNMNRWFRTKNRLHELVIYDFLSRYYTSEIAKTNKIL